jgi:hypothetical protein
LTRFDGHTFAPQYLPPGLCTVLPISYFHSARCVTGTQLRSIIKNGTYLRAPIRQPSHKCLIPSSAAFITKSNRCASSKFLVFALKTKSVQQYPTTSIIYPQNGMYRHPGAPHHPEHSCKANAVASNSHAMMHMSVLPLVAHSRHHHSCLISSSFGVGWCVGLS